MSSVRRVSLLLVCLAMFLQATDFNAAKSVSVEYLRAYVNGPMGRYSTWFSGVFYAGRDDKFDYVVVSRRIEVDIFKISIGKLGVRSHMKIQRNQKNWLNITEMFPPENNPN